jgi:hypothetical protein
MNDPMLSGAIVLAAAMVGLHFLRFWKDSRDPFFLCFALSFFIQAAQWFDSGLHPLATDYSPLHYLARLVAYGLIAFAILRRNALPKAAPGDP